MRRLVLSLVVLLAGSAAFAQNQLRGVYGPPASSAGKLGGVYGSPQPIAPAPLPSTVTEPDYGAGSGGVPDVSVPGKPEQGQALPQGVTAAPIPGRPGYGAAVVNGHHAIIDQSTNRIFQLQD